jgi:hypothetical protein
MAKTPGRSGKQWTSEETKSLRDLAKGNTPTRVIALKLDRSPTSVQGKAAELGVSLKPTNQSPYNRRPKAG